MTATPQYIAVAHSEARGRHYVAVTDIPKGALILVDNAHVTVLQTEVQHAVEQESAEEEARTQKPAVITSDDVSATSYALMVAKILSKRDTAPSAWKHEVDELMPRTEEEANRLYEEKMLPPMRAFVDKVTAKVAQLRLREKMAQRKTNEEKAGAANGHTAGKSTTGKEAKWRGDPPSLVRRVMLIVLLNAQTISLDNSSTVGLGLFPKASIFNHSCWPNASYYTLLGRENQTEGGESLKPGTGYNRLCVRAISDIRSGEEVFLCYCEMYATREDRRQFLREHYLFDCHCERCTEGSALSKKDEVLTALVCPRSECAGGKGRLTLVPPKTSDSEPRGNAGKKHHRARKWKCANCGTVMHEADLRQNLRELEHLLHRATTAANADHLVEAKALYDEFLRKADGFLHPLHIKLFRVRTAQMNITEVLLSSLSTKLERRRHENTAAAAEQSQPKEKSDSTPDVQLFIAWSRDLYDYSRHAAAAASVMLPAAAPEIASLLRVELRAMRQLQNIPTAPEQVARLEEAAAVCAARAREIYRISHGSLLMNSSAAAESAETPKQGEGPNEKQRERRRRKKEQRKQQAAAAAAEKMENGVAAS